MFLLITPLFYTNRGPHSGHKLTVKLAIANSRLATICGINTAIISGTDEHGDKVYKSYLEYITTREDEKGKSFEQYIQMRRQEFEKSLFSHFTDRNSIIYHTHTRMHMLLANQLYKKLLALGAIYPGEYNGYYDDREERYVSENEYKEIDDTEKALYMSTKSESGFYLKMRKEIKEKITSSLDKILIQQQLKNYCLNIIKNANDIFITRTCDPNSTIEHMTPIFGEENKGMYVWLDALLAYIISTQTYTLPLFDITIFAGRDIIQFLISPLQHICYELLGIFPFKIYAHGLITSQGRKVSKSYGNTIELEQLEAQHGQIMYSYFLSHITDQDLSITKEGIIQFENTIRNRGRNTYKRLVAITTWYRNTPNNWYAAASTATETDIYHSLSTLVEELAEVRHHFDGNKIFQIYLKLSDLANKAITEHTLWEYDTQKTHIFLLACSTMRIMLLIEYILDIPGSKYLLEQLNENPLTALAAKIKLFDCQTMPQLHEFDLK